MDLIIVESPTKAKTLSRFFGDKFEVEATLGHVKDLPKSPISVDIENNFEPDYKLVDKKKKFVTGIKKKAKKAKTIYLATDPDREGEAISAHVQEILEENGVNRDAMKRIVFHEITKSAVEEALEHPGKVNESLVNAQIARRVLDRIVGYKLSPVLWKKVRRGLSAGRVQTVAVRLIVEREREIEAFKPDEYWEITALLKAKGGEFEAKLVKIEGNTSEIKNEKTAKDIVDKLEKSTWKVISVEQKEVVRKPFAPFTTSTMTQAAANLFGWSSKKTMSIAQRLYEEGRITYHRTDSINVSESAKDMARNYIKKQYGENYIPENPHLFKKKSKLSQEAHEAIRPTSSVEKAGIDGKFADDAEKLYELIFKRFIASQMSSSIFDQTKIIVNAENEEIFEFWSNGQIMRFDGWRKLYSYTISEDKVLPQVNEGESLGLISLSPLQKFTQPPSRFNEASLIKTMEKLGIGRPSTYAPTISIIQIRNYVEKKDRAFYATNIGFAVNDFLLSNFPDTFDYSFTAQMEDKLDAVAKGDEKWQKMMDEFYSPFEKKLVAAEKAEKFQVPTEKLNRKCPKCEEGELVIRTGRFGKFISCSRYPECDYKDKYLDKIDMICPECTKGEIIIKTTKRGRTFYGCSKYPDCKWASWNDPRKSLEN